MTDALIPQPGLSDLERRGLRSSLVNRRNRLAALPPTAVGPRVAGLLAEVDEALDRLEGPEFGACTRSFSAISAQIASTSSISIVHGSPEK